MIERLKHLLQNICLEACVLCNRPCPLRQLCRACSQALLVPKKRCTQCGLAMTDFAIHCPDCARRRTHFDRTIVGFDYTPPTDLLIHLLKHQRHYAIAHSIAHLLAQQIQQTDILDAASWSITTIPSSPQSRLKRGFNPAGEIARHLARLLRLPLLRGLIKRRDDALFKQAHLNRQERAIKSDKLFSAAPCPSHLIIVDDIMTTGTTLNQASLACKQQGANTIIAIVATRGRYPHWDKYHPNANLFSLNK